MFQMVSEAEEIVTNPNRSVNEFGQLLHECWKVKRTLTGSITNSNLDEIYEAGRSAGALGGKILGAGGGGFMLFFRSARAAPGIADASKELVVCSVRILEQRQPRCRVRT